MFNGHKAAKCLNSLKAKSVNCDSEMTRSDPLSNLYKGTLKTVVEGFLFCPLAYVKKKETEAQKITILIL